MNILKFKNIFNSIALESLFSYNLIKLRKEVMAIINIYLKQTKKPKMFLSIKV